MGVARDFVVLLVIGILVFVGVSLFVEIGPSNTTPTEIPAPQATITAARNEQTLEMIAFSTIVKKVSLVLLILFLVGVGAGLIRLLWNAGRREPMVLDRFDPPAMATPTASTQLRLNEPIPATLTVIEGDFGEQVKEAIEGRLIDVEE